MQLSELLDSAQYITDQQGKRKGVLLDLEAWQALVQLVELNTTPNEVKVDEDTNLDQTPVVGGETVNQETAKRVGAMLREEAAFHKLHPSLYKRYGGKYVAIYNEELIDNDANQVALYRRVREKYPGEFVWIGPVNESPDETLVFRSPRFVTD